MIWLTQAMCKYRHTSCALLWDPVEMTTGEAERKIREEMAVNRLNDHCGICGNKLALEHAQTKYSTIEAARAAAGPIQAANVATRLILDRLGMTKEELN